MHRTNGKRVDESGVGKIEERIKEKDKDEFR